MKNTKLRWLAKECLRLLWGLGETMTMQWLTRNFIGIGIISIFISLNILRVHFFTLSALLVIFWLMLPYLVWAFINEFRFNTFPKHPRAYIGFSIAMPVIGFGVTYYTVLFPDAQNAFLILEIPLMQFLCLGVAWAACKKWIYDDTLVVISLALHQELQEQSGTIVNRPRFPR